MTTATATTAPERWLANVPPSAVRENIRGLWRIPRSEWIGASNGWLLIVERSDREGVPDLNVESNPLSWLEPSTESLGSRTVQALRKWAGEPVWPKKVAASCEACGGSGEIVSGTTCYDCDGEATWEEWEYGERRSERFGPASFDAALIALAAAVLPDDAEVTLYVEPTGPIHRMLGVAGDVRFVLASLRDLD